MNAALEFHDSEVSLVEGTDGILRLLFSAAYIHRSEGQPGREPGAGYMQPAEIIFSGASWQDLSPECSGYLYDGSLTVDGESLSLIPIPFTATGKITAVFSFLSAVLSVSASSVVCSVSGDPRFVENVG
ncbi:MAG: hypothetical protein Q7U84_07790 [Polynucleobacter sp.]|nr:hypothetical protein [Polynucleobacter sp.]